MKEDWKDYLIRGLALTILGILLFVMPEQVVSIFIVLLGIYLVVDSIFQFRLAFYSKSNLFSVQIIKAILTLVFGFTGLFSPLLFASITILPLFIIMGTFFIILGIIGFLGGDSKIKALITIVVGLLLMLKPLVVAGIFFYLFGAFLLVAGLALIVYAFLLRR